MPGSGPGAPDSVIVVPSVGCAPGCWAKEGWHCLFICPLLDVAEKIFSDRDHGHTATGYSF